MVLSLFFLTILGFSYTEVGFFKSDEIYYVDTAFNGLLPGPDRYLWHLINYFIVHVDIYLTGVPLKLINIPISVFTLLLLWKVFDKNYNVFYLPLFLPYYTFLSVFNLRDHLIILLSIAAVMAFFSSSLKGRLVFIATIIALFFLRSFSSAIIFIMLFVYIFFVWMGRLFHRRMNYNYFFVIAISIVIVLLFYPLIFDKFDVYYKWYVHTATVGADDHIQRVSGGISTGNRIVDFGISLVRYIVTPLPTSLISRLLQGGSPIWGWFDDVVRIFNQCGYYFLLLYLLINLKVLFRSLKAAAAEKIVIFLLLMSYWPIYSFHLYGSTHQRLKIPFQIAIFLMFLLVRDQKKNGQKASCNV